MSAADVSSLVVLGLILIAVLAVMVFDLGLTEEEDERLDERIT